MKLFVSLSIVLLGGLIASQGIAMEPAPDQMSIAPKAIPLLLSLQRQAAMKVHEIQYTSSIRDQLSPERKEQFNTGYNQLPEELRELVNCSSTLLILQVIGYIF